jgi:mycolipenoyl-CoA---2-(long-chain-fatty acyl)-trehalose mycolipenoyltransferase / long-chain-acyl-CoA---trehalose acyltransferase
MRVGVVIALGVIGAWNPVPGFVTSWHASPAAMTTALKAPKSTVPASYQQDQHLRAFRRSKVDQVEMARTCIGTWDISGVCDISAMTYAVNAHLRRHDTYHSWFEFNDAAEIIRRTIDDPSQIEFIPANYGDMGAAQLRTHLLGTTPDPLKWNCFTFGIVQRADHFTVYVSVDHLHTDGLSTGVIFLEIHMMYASILQGAPMPLPEPGSYHDFCNRQRDHLSAMTAQSPQVRGWIRFAQNNGGTLPDFPLPLGDRAEPHTGGMVTVRLMDERQSERFESACARAGARISGGVFACAALAEHELTGTHTYSGLTPYDMRSTPPEYLTAGWFASFIPITVPIGNGSFGEVVRAAQLSFDTAKELGKVPFDRVLELAPAELGLRSPEGAVPMLSFLDARKMPVTNQWDELNVGIYGDSRSSDQACMWLNRFAKGTTLTISFPDNPIARDSVARYIDAVKAVYARVADRDSAQTSMYYYPPSSQSDVVMMPINDTRADELASGPVRVVDNHHTTSPSSQIATSK